MLFYQEQGARYKGHASRGVIAPSCMFPIEHSCFSGNFKSIPPAGRDLIKVILGFFDQFCALSRKTLPSVWPIQAKAAKLGE